jgi:hypothetical protein
VRKIGLFLVLILIIVVLWVLFNKPSQGEITYKQTTLSPTPTGIIKRYEGQNLTFNFWDGYEVRQNSENNFTLLGPVASTEQWTIMLTAQSTIDENSGVILRRVKKDIYKEIVYEEGIMFVNESEAERVYFKNTNKGLLSVAAVRMNDENKFGELIKSILILN